MAHRIMQSIYIKQAAMELLESNRAGKRYMVGWESRTIHFGQKGAHTFADGASAAKRDQYIARHGAAKAGQNWSDPATPGFWSRWVLWEYADVKKAFAAAVKRARSSK